MVTNPECICRLCHHGLEDHDFVVVDSQVVEVICLSVSNRSLPKEILQ